MLIVGHGEPSIVVSVSCGLSSVHGQPVLPGGGVGSSLSVGQRISQPELWFPNPPVKVNGGDFGIVVPYRLASSRSSI